MGLLDYGFEDPNTAGLLSLGLRLMSTPGKFGTALGQAGLGAMGDMQRARAQQQDRQQAAQRQQLFELQMKQAQQAQADAELARANEARFRGMIPDPSAQAAQAALAGGGGPTLANAQQIRPVDPQQQMLFNAYQSGLIKTPEYLSATAPKAPEFKVVGDSLVQIGGGKVSEAYRAPTKPEAAPAAVREYQFAKEQEGYPGTFQQFELDKRRAGAASVSVNNGQRFENAYSTEQGKGFSEMMTNINKSAFSAPAQIRKLERMESLLEGVDGGKLAPTGLDIASGANAIGIKIDPKLGNKEAAQALAREIAGGFRQPGTGPMTDKDFENFLLQVPDLSKTAEGRKQITATMKSAANRDMQIAKMAREYERQYGRLDNAFLDEASRYIAENPVIAAPPGWKVRQ